jgi:hypothetical protein
LYALDGKLIKNYARIEEDQLVLPGNLTPGLYILQWQVQGSATPRTQKIMIKKLTGHITQFWFSSAYGGGFFFKS